MGGDFNVVKKMREKSGQSYDLATLAVFSDFINAMNLLDLPLSGGCFTWSNNRDPPRCVDLIDSS